ncbi:MAG: hypothetical protein H6867_09660 [Rhodospirillales bacterium]|nr:hypothetical protein [Rhodospirillales bacterium]
MDAILKGSEDHLLKYGWPMVEVNDEVASMPDSYIDGLGEQDIKAYRFESFEHKVDDVLAVREMLQNAVVDARTIESLKPVHRRVVKLDNKPPAKINDTQRQIISRTALAAERILTGPSAYL